MKYMSSKSRIAKYIVPILQECIDSNIEAIIKECQKLDKLMALVAVQEDESVFTAVCDHIASHCDDLIYTHITKGYASFVFSNNSKIEVVTDKCKGKGKKYNSMIIDKNIDSELIKTIFAPFNLSYKEKNGIKKENNK